MVVICAQVLTTLVSRLRSSIDDLGGELLSSIDNLGGELLSSCAQALTTLMVTFVVLS
jgi:hypothetical protein